MKRYVPKVLLLCVVGCVLASGAAFAANIQCEMTTDPQNPEACTGTLDGDRMNGTSGNDFILGLSKSDYITGLGGDDEITGGSGADLLEGGKGNDNMAAPGVRRLGNGRVELLDDSSDLLRGGPGNDLLYGGFGQGGIDALYGGSGFDVLIVSQRTGQRFGAKTAITKEIVECGSGFDLVEFDQGVDLVDKKTCEERIPVNADGEPVGGGFEEERSKSNFLHRMSRLAE